MSQPQAHGQEDVEWGCEPALLGATRDPWGWGEKVVGQKSKLSGTWRGLLADEQAGDWAAGWERPGFCHLSGELE